MEPKHTTPVPNALFDVHLKDLKCAELKVILVIIRQTLGWSLGKNTKARKTMDWISGSQLQSKTGNSRRAISSAIDVLVKSNLIEISNGIISLDKASDRQGKTRLYYRLSPTLTGHVDNEGTTSGNDCIPVNTTANSAQEMRKKVISIAQNMRITKETL